MAYRSTEQIERQHMHTLEIRLQRQTNDVVNTIQNIHDLMDTEFHISTVGSIYAFKEQLNSLKNISEIIINKLEAGE